MDEALVSCMSLCSKCFVLRRTHEAIASRRQATVGPGAISSSANNCSSAALFRGMRYPYAYPAHET